MVARGASEGSSTSVGELDVPRSIAEERECGDVRHCGLGRRGSASPAAIAAVGHSRTAIAPETINALQRILGITDLFTRQWYGA